MTRARALSTDSLRLRPQVHEVSGALATANSRRLRTLENGAERDVAFLHLCCVRTLAASVTFAAGGDLGGVVSCQRRAY